MHARTLKRCSQLWVAVTMGGCGVAHELYDLRNKQLDRCRVELSQTQSDLRGTRLGADELATESSDLRDRLLALQMDRTQLAQSLQSTQKDLDAFIKARKIAERQGQLMARLKDSLRSLLEVQKLSLDVRRGKLTLTLAESTLFEVGRADLRSDAQNLIAQLAAAFRQERSREFLVNSRVDNVMTKGSPFHSNWDLTTAQSVSVVRALQAEGVDPRWLIAGGASEFELREAGEVTEGRRPPRRVEIILQPTPEELFPFRPPAP